jgi:hypothetical protein
VAVPVAEPTWVEVVEVVTVGEAVVVVEAAAAIIIETHTVRELGIVGLRFFANKIRCNRENF